MWFLQTENCAHLEKPRSQESFWVKKKITDEFILKADEALSILNICIFHTHINIKIGPLSTFLQSNKLGYSNSKSSS